MISSEQISYDNDNEIELLSNGLTIAKSSNNCLCPILCPST